ncbi:unnamed protein product [Lepeophtheirus salmonis]|uniref:(salmon louse) hypothetical protein n=1 Tax=Lepeophtheirus salmonis TaxID=72036 RepID=A0A7R8HB05_LEPSM|nr:unnamed protein product [Lepeophtheirus salmonis]CAF2966725.1 unnamed protein product [Lepeophtheirus salmonis]
MNNNFISRHGDISQVDLVRIKACTSFRVLVSKIMIDLDNVAFTSATRLCGDISLSFAEQEVDVMSQDLKKTNDDITRENIQIIRISQIIMIQSRAPVNSKVLCPYFMWLPSAFEPVGRQSIKPTISQVTNFA